MAIQDRRLREREARRRLITVTARRLAEREGWEAVTTRRLSAEIEYSQPVIYKHFASMEELAEAIALEGFTELGSVLAEARGGARAGNAVGAAARAYLAFAAEQPALYDAMFNRATRLPFGAADAPAELSTAYGELRGAVSATAGEGDVDTLTELLWSTLHGLATLGRGGRLRQGGETERIELLVAQFSATRPAGA